VSQSGGAAADRPPWAPRSPVLVIGDICTDVFLRVVASRLSRESPLPVFSLGGAGPRPAVEVDGGAGNVARQLQAYGIDVTLLPIAYQPKVRLLAGDPAREVFRLDGVWRPAKPATIGPAVANLEGRTFSAVVYVDYQGRAGPTPAVWRILQALPRECPLLVDARASLLGWAGADLVKMHVTDAGLGENPHPAEIRAALARSGASVLVLTRGAAGHILAGQGWISSRPPMPLPGPVLNTSGAGDVFTGTLAALIAGRPALLQSRPLLEAAAECAGRAAALRVRKAGYNEAVSFEEIEQWLRSGMPSP
jgi:sugar/nucleoside kinase (ribokinase family)